MNFRLFNVFRSLILHTPITLFLHSVLSLLGLTSPILSISLFVIDFIDFLWRLSS